LQEVLVNVLFGLLELPEKNCYDTAWLFRVARRNYDTVWSFIRVIESNFMILFVILELLSTRNCYDTVYFLELPVLILCGLFT